ncbi:PAAR motif protein [Vibrio mangrovi]|uniref:PAAR motif protein n=2 Tax=Vibrio mangrovi TaxID=474394 RepID=A0A1Y6IXT7_9VIBR|nr:PAAR motif protein [Vibrio mangrovi]
MPAAARLGDNCAGHGCFPATPIMAGSGDVSINGKPAARKGDMVLLHACPCPQFPHGMHGRSISAGSSNVSINGKPAARVGDAIDCGGSVAAGSGNVFIGDTPYKSPTHKCGEGAAMEQSPFLRIQPLAEAPPFDWASLPFVEESYTRAAEKQEKVVESKGKPTASKGTLSGTRTKIPKKADEATRRSLIRENEAVDALVAHGLDVQQNPVIKGTKRNPDLLIVKGKIEDTHFDNVVADVFSPGKNTSARNIRSTINEKVNIKKQAETIVLNMDDSQRKVAEIVDAIKAEPVTNLKNVIVTQNGKVTLLPLIKG